MFRPPWILKNKTTAYKNMVSALLLGLDCGILLNGYLSKPLVFSAAAPIVTGLVRVCGWERRAAAGRGGPPPGRASTAGRRIWDRRRPLLYEDEFELTFDLSGLQPDTPDPQPEPVPEPEAEPAPGRSRRRPRQKIPTQKCSGLRRTGRAC